jgi:arabinoxylan arabinofuranohydrolase
MIKLVKKYGILYALLFQLVVHADNCFITGYPTSDPAPSVFTYHGVTKAYLYCTQDKVGFSGNYPIDTIHCYSSSDMFHWKDEGCVLDEQHVPWAKKGNHKLWAPHVVSLKGLYRMYLPETAPDGKYYNFMATSKSPTGPFTPAASGRLPGLDNNCIDPFCFIDADSSVWLSYRHHNGSDVGFVRMDDSGTAVTGSITNDVVNTGAGSGYKEGAWMWKRNSLYYLVFAFHPNNFGNEVIAYSMASNRAGPWTYKGQIMERNANEFTIHSGVCELNGKWYFFWHGTTFDGSIFGSERCSGIEYMTYNDDGTLKPMYKTCRGVGMPNAISDTIQIDRYSSICKASSTAIPYDAKGTEKTGWYISGIADNSWVQYNDVDFTPDAGNEIGSVVARVSSTNANGSIEMRLGSYTGTLLGTISVPNTKSLTTWQTTNPATLLSTKPPAGVYNLCCVFKASASGTYQVNWIKFEQMPVTAIGRGNEPQ